MDWSSVGSRALQAPASGILPTLCQSKCHSTPPTQTTLLVGNSSAGLVTQFYEKPSGPVLESMAHASRNATPELPFEASMGIYVFNRDVLVTLLGPPALDNTDSGAHFGLDIIPKALREDFRVVSHHFGGYFRVRLRANDWMRCCWRTQCAKTLLASRVCGMRLAEACPQS